VLAVAEYTVFDVGMAFGPDNVPLCQRQQGGLVCEEADRVLQLPYLTDNLG
jgi:hypothetical protein